MLVEQVYRVQKDDWVLIHAAAGGVGLLLCQWARHLGAHVIGTVSTSRKAEVATRAGCKFVVISREEDFVARTLDITAGEGVQVTYDSIGKDTFFGSLKCLAPCGHLANFGQASGAVEPFEVSQLFPKSNSLSRPNVMEHLRTPKKLRVAAAALFDALSAEIIEAGEIKPIPLRDASQAHTELESRERTASLVLKP